jgi:inosine/xanthosine triphosphatase
MSNEMFRSAPSLSRALAGAPIRVGTENSAKLSAVRVALQSFSPDAGKLSVVPVAVESGVPEQPIGWEEIVRGARNRARAAFASGDCALAAGIEDGLVRLAEGEKRGADASDSEAIYNVGCAWLTDGEREGHGFSALFAYPHACLEPAVRDQAPVGALFDALWRTHRSTDSEPATALASGRRGGNIGLLTQQRLDRSAYGAQAIICALTRFLHTDLYD